MKQIIGVLTAFVVGFVISVSGAQAREGSIQLSNPDVSCEGVSLWRESGYKVTGRCQGLVYPYETLYDHYVLWAKLDNGNTVRIDDIDRGYFEGNITDSFSSIFITAEGAGTPRRPSTKEIVTGSISAFAFDKSTTTAPAATPAPSVKPAGTTATSTVTQTGSTIGSVIGRILKALVVIVGVIIVVAVVASLLFRRRGSISA